MANWYPLTVEVPGKDLLEPVRSILETLLIFLDVLSTILDTIKVFLVDFGNPIAALVEALLKLIEEALNSLKVSGVHAYYDIPDPTVDPKFDKILGGYEAFAERFKSSLYDPLDFNRPQPRQGSSQGGFVLLVVDAPNIYALLSRLKQLLRFLGREFTMPRYEAPSNFQAELVDSRGVVIRKLADLFRAGNSQHVQLKWSLPTTVTTPDPGFNDMVSGIAKEFLPASWLIEKAEANPAVSKINISQLGDPNAVGYVTYDRNVTTTVSSSTVTVRQQPLQDTYGDPVLKFQKYLTLGASSFTSIVGQLGTFRWIDASVVPGRTYYYRLRAYSGDLSITNDALDFPSSVDQLTFTIEADTPVLTWPSPDDVEMGKPSGLVAVTVPLLDDPNAPGYFDVMRNLRDLFASAFSLDFHGQTSGSAQFGATGLPLAGTAPEEIGRGSLTNHAGMVSNFRAGLIAAKLAGAPTVREARLPNPITGESPDLPWQEASVKKRSAQLASSVATALIQAGPPALNGFRALMQGALQAGPVNVRGLVQATSLEAVVARFTVDSDDEGVLLEAAQTFAAGYSDAALRLNVLVAIRYVNSYSSGGVPADWIAVVPLRDIIPWSGQLLYDILDKIRALLDGFKGVMGEIQAFIDNLQRKIAALERFIQYLISILNFIESLELSVYVLSVPSVDGPIQAWTQEIDNAGGVKPSSGPGGYSAGVAFGYVAPDVSAFADAFSIIFGGD